METQRRASIHDGIKVVLLVSIFPLSLQLTMNLLPKRFEAMLPELGMLTLFPSSFLSQLSEPTTPCRV